MTDLIVRVLGAIAAASILTAMLHGSVRYADWLEDTLARVDAWLHNDRRL